MSVEFDRGSPGKFDSRTLSRETLGRWTGRSNSWAFGKSTTVTLLRIAKQAQSINSNSIALRTVNKNTTTPTRP